MKKSILVISLFSLACAQSSLFASFALEKNGVSLRLTPLNDAAYQKIVTNKKFMNSPYMPYYKDFTYTINTLPHNNPTQTTAGNLSVSEKNQKKYQIYFAKITNNTSNSISFRRNHYLYIDLENAHKMKSEVVSKMYKHTRTSHILLSIFSVPLFWTIVLPVAAVITGNNRKKIGILKRMTEKMKPRIHTKNGAYRVYNGGSIVTLQPGQSFSEGIILDTRGINDERQVSFAYTS